MDERLRSKDCLRLGFARIALRLGALAPFVAAAPIVPGVRIRGGNLDNIGPGLCRIARFALRETLD